MAEKKKYSNIDLSVYDSGYQASDAEKAAYGKKTDYESQVDNWSATPYARENDLQSVIDQRLNRGKFSYDLNGDALYQQYKDNYIQQGKMAMQDAMGQAAAMTGGYGNSYAATVGNQAYQGYLQGLNDVVPQLYQMALDRYNLEGNELDSKYGLLSSEKANHMSEQEAALNRLMSQRDYYSGEAYNLHNTGYGEWSNKRDYDTKQYWDETNFGLASDEYDLSKRSVSAQEEANRLAKQQAENEVDYSQITKFKNAIVDEDKLEKITVGSRGNTGNGGYRYGGKRYATYQDYVKAQLNDHYSKFGTINAGTLAYLLDFYGIE